MTTFIIEPPSTGPQRAKGSHAEALGDLAAACQQLIWLVQAEIEGVGDFNSGKWIGPADPIVAGAKKLVTLAECVANERPR